MADNFSFSAGSGLSGAADDIGGVLYQRIKLCLGADGSAVDAVAGAGAVSTAVMRMTLASDDPAVTILTALQKAEDAAHSTGDKGIMGLTVRQDTAAALGGTDGDYQPLITDGSGRVWCAIGGDALTSLQLIDDVVKTEDAAASSGDKGIMALAVQTASPADAATDGDYAWLQMKDGRLYVTAVVTSNALPTGAATAANQATLIGHVDTLETLLADVATETSLSLANGTLNTIATAFGGGVGSVAKAEDAASASGDLGMPAMAIQKATPADTAAADDYVMLQMSGGRLWTNGIATGDVAHDAADSGSPVKVGGKATTSQHGLTLAADADRVNYLAGVDGVQLTRPHTNLESIVSGNANNTDGTSTECIAAGGSGVKQYLTSVVLTNTSSSNIYVEVKSGTTVKATIPVPANGGAVFNPPVPLPPNAANEAWNFDPSAATTTVYCSMIGFKSKI